MVTSIMMPAQSMALYSSSGYPSTYNNRNSLNDVMTSDVSGTENNLVTNAGLDNSPQILHPPEMSPSGSLFSGMLRQSRTMTDMSNSYGPSFDSTSPYPSTTASLGSTYTEKFPSLPNPRPTGSIDRGMNALMSNDSFYSHNLPKSTPSLSSLGRSSYHAGSAQGSYQHYNTGHRSSIGPYSIPSDNPAISAYPQYTTSTYASPPELSSMIPSRSSTSVDSSLASPVSQQSTVSSDVTIQRGASEGNEEPKGGFREQSELSYVTQESAKLSVTGDGSKY